MRIILCYLLTIILSLTDMTAQVAFIKHYGDFSGEGNSVIVDYQGNFLLAGTKYQSQFGKQFCVYKINSTR